MSRIFCFLLLGLATCALPLQGQVVINEVFYHAPGKLKDLQWIELHNPTDQPVSLAGWKLAKGVKFTFPANVTLAPQGYVVICKNRELFARYYRQATVVGEFEKSLKEKGERIDLRDAQDNLADSLTFTNVAPWPTAANGGSSSLERICPTVPSGQIQNWAASAPAEDHVRPTGTPGERNSVYAEFLPPTIDQVKFSPAFAQPGQPIQVEARIQDSTGVREAVLAYQVVGNGALPEEKTVPLVGAGGSFTATIPGQADGRIIRFCLRAVNEKGGRRFYPAENEPRPWLACLSQKLPEPGTLPLAFIIHTAGEVEPFEKRGGLVSQEERMRQMAVRQWRGLLNLAPLWAALTLDNAPAENAFKLVPIFAAQCANYSHAEQAFMASPKPAEFIQNVRLQIQTFKKSLGDTLAPLLSTDQAKALAAWQDSPTDRLAERRSGNFRIAPAFETDYLSASTLPGLTLAQFTAVRASFRSAIQQRDALHGVATGPRIQLPTVQANLKRDLKAALLTGATAHLSRPLIERILVPQESASAALVYLDAKTRAPQLFDDVRLFAHHGGYKIHFNKGEWLNGMPTINLAFKEEAPRWALTEPLAYEFHRRAGQDVCRIDYARLTVDGTLQGYCLIYEQVNQAFLRRLGLNDQGNLYKGTCHDNTVEGQNIWKSGEPGHADVLSLVERLEQTKTDPAAQWEIIRREFDAEKLVHHYAARIVLSDWDGFFNNYSLYHDTHGTKKWTFYVWDQDKTWGDYDGYPNLPALIHLPLTYAAEGDRPEGWTEQEPPNGFRAGNGHWWRPGSHLSKPILANPIFRQFFLARIKDLLDKEFTPERLNPLIDQLPARLEAEVQLRAKAANRNPDEAAAEFHHHLDSIKDFIVQRRAWLLAQPEIQSAGPFEPAKLK